MPEPVTDLGPIDYEEDAAFDDQIASWQRGSWFNFYDGKEVTKVKLRWVSPLRTLYMFSGGEDKTARVLSPETIKSYLRKGYLKPLESVPLTKRIVDRVANELEQSPKIAEKLAGKMGVNPRSTRSDTSVRAARRSIALQSSRRTDRRRLRSRRADASGVADRLVQSSQSRLAVQWRDGKAAPRGPASASPCCRAKVCPSQPRITGCRGVTFEGVATIECQCPGRGPCRRR